VSGGDAAAWLARLRRSANCAGRSAGSMAWAALPWAKLRLRSATRSDCNFFCSSASMAFAGRACGTSKTSSRCGGCVGGDGTEVGSPPAQGGILSTRKPDTPSALGGAVDAQLANPMIAHVTSSITRLRTAWNQFTHHAYRCPRPATPGRHDVGIALFVTLSSCRLRFRCGRQRAETETRFHFPKRTWARPVAVNRGGFVRCLMLTFQLFTRPDQRCADSHRNSLRCSAASFAKLEWPATC